MKRKMNKALCILLAFVMLATALPSFTALAAGELIEGTHVRWSYNADTKTLTFSGYGPMPDYTPTELPPIPSVPWLEAEREAETLVIGEGVTTVGDCCFMLMPALTRAVLPESLIRIGIYNFYACKNLAEVNLPAGLLSIGDASFLYGALTSIEIPAGVKTMEYCFDYMFRLTEVTLHEGLESIENCFECSGLQSLTIPSTVVSVTGCDFTGLKTLVNRSPFAIVHEQMDSFADPADLELQYEALSLECDMYLDYYFLMLSETYSEEALEAAMDEAYPRMLEELRVWLNANRGTALETAEEVEAYMEGRFNRTGAPAADAEIYCMSGSAEDKALDKTSIPHYLIDRDNALCDRPPEYTGSAGEHITWTVDAATGTLTFTGYGDMESNLDYAGYHRLDDVITSVVFECTEGPITHIADYAFKGLVNLTELTLPDGLESLGLDIIMDSGVRRLTLPGTLLLENYNYYWMTHSLRLGTTPLQRIDLSGESDRYFTEHGALYSLYIEEDDGPRKITLEKLPAEALAYPLADGLSVIKPYALDGLADLTSFTVPGTVESISMDAFYNLPALENVTIEPGEDALRRQFPANSFSDSTTVPSFTVSEDDARFFVRDGVLYDKPEKKVLIVPGDMTSLDLAEDVRGIDRYILRWGEAFERITVRGEDFSFFDDDWRYSPVSYVNENTVIVCRRNTEAENYALRFGCPVEYLEDVTLTNISLIADTPLETPEYEECVFRELGICALLTYSDGAVREVPAQELWYDQDGCSFSRTFSQRGDYELKVSFGGAEEIFTLSVVQSPVVYRFDTRMARTEFALWESITADSLKVSLWRIDPDTGAESKVGIYNAALYYWDGTDWASISYSQVLNETGVWRLKLAYRGYEQELTVNVSTDDVLFTTNADEAITEIPQFAAYDKNYGGNRLFMTHNGETTEITDKLTVSGGYQNNFYAMTSVYYREFIFPDTTVLGDTTFWLCADYSFFDGICGTRYFKIMIPLEVRVVPGEVTDAYLDVSDVPEYVPAGATLTAGDLGVKLVKTMADGSVQIEENPAVIFHWNYDPGTYAGDTFQTGGDRAVHNVRVNYGSISANFMVRVHKHAMTYVPADAGANCRCTGCIEHWHCTSCGRNYAEEEAVTELTNVSDGVYGPHFPGALHAGYAATCTEDGLTEYCVCAVCGKLTDEEGNLLENPVIPAGHDYGEWIHEIPPTCLENGIAGHYTCAGCGQYFNASFDPIYDLSIPMVNHDYVETARRDATCETAGSVTYTCRNDYSHTYTETIPATGHRHTEFRGKIEATRDAHGHEAGAYCTDCGKYVSGGEDIHNKNGRIVPVREATWLDEETYNYCCANGDYIVYCTVCDGWGLYAKETLVADGLITDNPDQPGGSFLDRLRDKYNEMMSGIIEFLLRLIKWFGNIGKK